MKKNGRLRKILFVAATICAGLLTLGLLMEMFLAAGIFDDRLDPNPVYIPKKFKAMDFAINRTNHLVAQKNPFYFNDVPRNLEKPEKTVRIAVLGDSFIFGDGARYDTVWSHKLERIISSNYENVEVVSFGRNGWSTEDERKFLAADGFQFKPDVVVVGCNANDLSSYFHTELRFFYEGGAFEKIVKSFFPRTFEFFTSYFKRFYEINIDNRYDYATALASLYGPEGLKSFEDTVRSMKQACDRHGVGLVFVLTPDSPSRENKEYLGKLGTVFLKTSVTCLDLFPAVDAKFADVNPRTLWANPANRHPGDLLTQLFADEVYRFLKKAHFLTGAKKGKRRYVTGEEALAQTFPSDIRPFELLRREGRCGAVLELPRDLAARANGGGITEITMNEDGQALKHAPSQLEVLSGSGLFNYNRETLAFSPLNCSDPVSNGKTLSLSTPRNSLLCYIHIRDKIEALRLILGRLQYEGRDSALAIKAESLKAEVAASAGSLSP